MVWYMKSLSKLWNSKNLHSLCRVLQKREKEGDENLLLRSAFAASTHSQIFNFHPRGFLSPIFCHLSSFLYIWCILIFRLLLNY